MSRSDERLYLSPLYGKLLVSNAHKLAVHRLEDGRLLNTVHYYKYRRLSSEIDKGEWH